MIVGGFVINMQEEVATAMMVKWLVLEGVVVGAEIVLERQAQRLRARYG
jgi:hypothetical protein